jgi:serine phosphatase RsbU (regulator of sigma subunit)
MKLVSDRILADTLGGMFVTAFYGVLDPVTGQLNYCNAGHNPPALYRSQTDQVEWLEPCGAALGLMENNPLTSRAIELNEGDTLLLYTDGVIDATSPENTSFGAARMAEVIRQNAGLPAVDLVHSIRRSLLDITDQGLLEDDITLVAAKVAGG